MAKKEIRSIEIEPAENGGHTVTHRYKDMQRDGKHGMVSNYIEPEHHVFGPEDGHEMLAHVANHLEIPENEGDEKGGTGKTHNKGNLERLKADMDEFLDEEEEEEKPRRMTKDKAKRVREKVA